MHPIAMSLSTDLLSGGAPGGGIKKYVRSLTCLADVNVFSGLGRNRWIRVGVGRSILVSVCCRVVLNDMMRLDRYYHDGLSKLAR